MVCEVYENLENTTKGLEKTSILADFLGEIEKKGDYEIIYLLQGNIFADYDSREIGISEQLMTKAIAKAMGVSEERVTEEFREKGDLGKAVEEIEKNKKQSALFSSKLDVEKVLNNLRKLPSLEGKGAVSRKIDLIVELLHAAKPKEAKYLVRLVLGDLKIGVGGGLLRDAIVEHCFKPKDIPEKKEYVDKVQAAYDKVTDFAEVFEKSCKNNLESISLSPGKPVKVMLYPKAKDVEDAFRIVGEPAAFEFKYDGFRIMINKDGEGNVKLFTRRLEDVSNQFPDVVDFVKEYVDAESFIVDGEVVGYDPKTKKYKEFQAISQRIKRKYDIDKMAKELPVELRVFDIIYCDGEDLIDKGFKDRRELLEKIVKEKKYSIRLAEQIVTSDVDEAQEFFDKALAENQEGLMGKGLDKPYRPGARIGYGVKIKPEDKDFDLVITGAEWGTGKRGGWLTSYEVSCRDENGDLLEVGKVSTGLKEKKEGGVSFEEMTEKLKKIITEEEGRKIKVKPEIVVSVQYQNIQKSPTYSSGWALRFPRILRLRPDRGVEDLTSLEEIEEEGSE